MSHTPPLSVGIIIQARMGSTRLPGKTLKKIGDKSLLEILLERLLPLQDKVKIVVATTTHNRDDLIAKLCEEKAVAFFRGSEEDVLSRTLFAARHFDIDVIVRITSDCPLIDYRIILEAIMRFLARYPTLCYLSNTVERTYPRGEDIEIFKRRALERAHLEAINRDEREHVTPFLWRHPELFPQEQFIHLQDLSSHRWTVDTEEDFSLICAIVEALYPKNPLFSMEEVLLFLEKNPKLLSLNAHIVQNKFSHL